ncbi:hypothetical protein C0J50_4478 [Silurus asotus]|uniref:Transcription factor TFIIIB component B'' Myb domain-containing protein n=1 Tax=Silurus asotus TaxID=30991 RepID=A0AAD5FDE3_SILAS|nr:hypothetical protein C0J50_4478 [Silurus asotus]
MIRRSRISVRPNVKPVGRSAATSRETPQESETPVEVSNDAGVKAGGQKVAPEVKADCTVPAVETSENAGSQNGYATDQSDLSVTAADVSDQRASAGSLSTRRKRFSVLPNLSKPRSTPSSSLTSSKHSKSPVGSKSTPEIPPASLLIPLDDNQESAPDLLSVSTKSLRSPAPKLPSSSSNNTSRSSTFLNQAVNTTEPTPQKTLSAPECTPELPPGPIAKSEGKPKRKKPKPVTPTQDSVETSPGNQDPAESSQSDPAPVSKSQNEPVIQDGSDFRSSGSSKKPEQHVPQALRTLNDPADRLRLARAKKLRELLKKEMNKQKQKEKQRPQTGGSEMKSTKDHTKMTMRDLIYYLPSTNPMKSHTEDEQRAETDFPSSPKAVAAVQSATEQNAVEQEEDEEQGGEDEEPMLAPRVKVAEDGSLIIDEESMVGTDFSMIGQLFPHRARVEIKNKFKKEERANSWRIDKAFKEKRRLDLDFFNKLLAQILKDEEERRKKKKRTSEMDKKDSEDEEEPDLTTIQEHILNKPTRSGRIPKLSQHMIRATADEEDDEEEEQLPPCRGSQRNEGRSVHVPRRGKSRLVTLRASPTEDEEEEYGTYQDEENDFTNVEEENQAFVPMGLRSVTVLDISVNVPDILGISQNAVCPESSCERALTPMGSVPCEHQLNLLVDVIEFLTPEHMEVSEEAARTLLTIGHSAHITQSGEPSSTGKNSSVTMLVRASGDIIIVEDSSSHVHEEVLVETMDQSQTEFEPCVVVTSDPASETDPVIKADKTITPSPSHDSAFTAEPISSQESSDPFIKIQPETLSISAPEPTSSKTQRNLLPKHKSNMRKASKTTIKEPAEALASSSEKISAPVKGDEEAVESHLSTHPEPEEHLSEISEEQEKDRREDCSSVVSLEKKIEDGETREKTQEAHSESIPSSSGSECSVKPSQSVRRCRGPKPKPNLVRSVRTTHTVTHTTQNLPAVPSEKPAPVNACTDIRQPEGGAHIISEPRGETPTDPVTVIPDADPEELPPSACEPVFILSLTEVLPTLTEGAGLVADPLPLSAAPESLSEPIRATETPTADVGGTGPAGDQVFSQLLTDPLIPVSEERENENRENESRRGKKKQSSSQARRGEHSPLMQKSSAPEEPDEPAVEPSSSSSSIHNTEENIEETELPAKRSKLSESSRRAKLQIKPKQTPKKPCCELSSSDETASVPASSREMALEETEPRPLESKHLLTEAPSSHSLDESSKAPTAATTLRPHVRAKAPPPQTPSSSQGIVENISNPHTGPVETCGVQVGVESQPAQQNTHQASTGPLMRPGRRPKGFLSFMSSTSVQRPSESSRVPQKPAVITSRAGRRRAAPSTSAPPPTSSLQMSSEPQPESSNTGGENQEPTSVSAFFFNDIFTVVDEQGDT